MLLVGCVALGFNPINANASVKLGAACKKEGQVSSLSGKKLICQRKGSKLIWTESSKGKTKPSARPAPVTTVSPNPVVEPSIEPLKSKSISERWNAIDTSALNVFNQWATREIPTRHNIKIIWTLSDKADVPASEEIKRRYDLAARFWAPYSTVTKDFKVLIANHNEAKWICDIKKEWLQINQDDCEEIESNGRASIPTAGQLQNRNRNVDMYQVRNLAEMNTRFFYGRVEHEFTHNIFYEQSERYQKFMPCWQIEGGAEYFGILIANRLDPNSFIQARNIALETDFLGLGEKSWKVEDWVNYLNETDRSQIANRQGDTCGPVRPKIYHLVILANEYLVLKLGIPGYLQLIKDADQSSWADTVQKTFGVEKQIFYREMASYMMTQYHLARDNRWSYEALYSVPYGR